MFSFQGKKKRRSHSLSYKDTWACQLVWIRLCAQTHKDSNHFHANWRFLPGCNDFMAGAGSAHEPVIYMQTNITLLFRMWRYTEFDVGHVSCIFGLDYQISKWSIFQYNSDFRNILWTLYTVETFQYHCFPIWISIIEITYMPIWNCVALFRVLKKP